MRHRPFGIAGPRQEPPSRRRAPQRGAAFAPSRRSQRNGAWASLLISRPSPRLYPPPPPPLPPSPLAGDDRLSTFVHMDVLDDDGLLAARAKALNREDPLAAQTTDNIQGA